VPIIIGDRNKTVLIAGIGIAVLIVTLGSGVIRRQRSFDRDELRRFRQFADKMQRELVHPFE
jgi:uncharacterized membrane-anchored protein YhcB (DUF1043 family)